MTTIRDILDHLFLNLPKRLSADWDNVGLLCGDGKKRVKKALVCLDINNEVIAEAIKLKADLILSHHPLFLNSIKSVTPDTLEGGWLIELIKNDIGAICMHTNLDIANGGINDILAKKANLTNIKILKTLDKETYMKLAVFVPKEYEALILNAMFKAGAGEIGDYTMCSFSSNGVGTYLPSGGAQPFIGGKGELYKGGEVKCEVILPKLKKDAVLSAMLRAHPYETPAFDLYDIEYPAIEAGIGRIGELSSETGFEDFLKLLKQKFNCGALRYVKLKDSVKSVAVCGGSGAFLINDVLKSGADVFVCGELKYHDFCDAHQMGLSVIELGHFESEDPGCQRLVELLAHFDDVNVVKSGVCKSPIEYF